MEITTDYKRRVLKQKYISDLICYEKIIVELKAAKAINDEHRAQVMNYLKATGIRLGILVHFGHHSKLEYERFVM